MPRYDDGHYADYAAMILMSRRPIDIIYFSHYYAIILFYTDIAITVYAAYIASSLY